MAASRKLQAEIDRCLKKVSEGVDLFEEVWTKVHNATNPNQKEKYETDLKKEIKKLQRLRDQIKTWIASGEIKDKSTLVETRKLIETQMERFKVVERETKTKAYSKEGLGLVTKADPITKERDDLNTWLINTIDNMQMQIDSFESDIESLLVFKKKKLDKEKQEKLDMFKRVVEKHKFHVGKLEVILRTLDNIANEEKLPIFLTQVKKIKEDVDYYLDSAQDPDYEDNVFLYDDIECLDDLLGSGVGSSISPTPTPVMDTNPSTPTLSTGPMSPSFQQLTAEKQQQEYLRQQALLQQHHYEHGFTERRKSYTEESTSAAKIFKPLPVKPTFSGSVGDGNYGSKIHTMSLSNNNVSSFGQNSNEVPEPIVIEPQRQAAKYEVKISNYTPPALESGDSGPNKLNSFVSEVETKPARPPPLIPEFRFVKPSRVQTPTPPPFQPVPVNLPPPNEPLPEVAYPSNGITHTQTHHQPQRPTSLDLERERETQHLEQEQECLNDLQVLPNSHSISNNNHMSLSMSPGLSRTGSSPVMLHPKAVRSEPTVVRTEPEPIVTYIHPLVEKEPDILPPQPHVEEELHQEEELQLPALQTQPLHPSVNNAPHVSLTPSQEQQILIEQYMSSSESNPLDSHLTTLKSMAQEVMTRAGLHFAADQRPVSEETTCAHIPPLLGVAPLGPVPLQQKHDYQLAMLEAAHYHMPVPADSEPLRQYLPRNPIPTPSYYPQAPLLNSDSLDFFGRLSIETLFFIFYYLEGTRAQYMAAKVLKKQSWRFHTKFMMWFQRHEEPKVINEVYEQGTYIYFDIEKWGQRKKDGFVFEYQYLEDRDLN